MSGFEIVGVVLGVVPIVITVLEGIKTGKGFIGSMLQWDSLTVELVRELILQNIFLKISICSRFPGASMDEILQEAKAADDFGEFFDPVIYPQFLKSMEVYEKSFTEALRKLMKILGFKPTPDQQLFALGETLESTMRQTTPPKKLILRTKSKLSFAMSRSYISDHVKTMIRQREHMEKMIARVSTDASVSEPPSGTSKSLAKEIAHVQKVASPIFRAMCAGCFCTCEGGHHALMRLDNMRLLSMDLSPRTIKRDCTFELVLDLSGNLQDLKISALRSEGSHQLGNRSAAQARAHSTASASVPSLRVPEIRIAEEGIEFINICEKASKAWKSGLILQLQLRQGGLAMRHGPNEISRHSLKSTITLRHFLSNNQDSNRCMVPKQKTLLALDIASSLLQFHLTDWVGRPVTSEAVKILIGSTAMGPIDRYADMEPFIEKYLDQQVIEPHDTEPEPGTDPNLDLLELAIILLEIWEHKTLEQRASATKASIGTPGQRYTEANYWLVDAKWSLPTKYQEAIRKCLGHWAGGRRWHEQGFLAELCEDVLKPLQETCKVWGPDPRRTI